MTALHSALVMTLNCESSREILEGDDHRRLMARQCPCLNNVRCCFRHFFELLRCLDKGGLGLKGGMQGTEGKTERFSPGVMTALPLPVSCLGVVSTAAVSQTGHCFRTPNGGGCLISANATVEPLYTNSGGAMPSGRGPISFSYLMNSETRSNLQVRWVKLSVGHWRTAAYPLLCIDLWRTHRHLRVPCPVTERYLWCYRPLTSQFSFCALYCLPPVHT